jgi:ATP-binding cassette subfamily C (CFTR/MRP) protein 1
MNATAKENILFGSPFDEAKYKEVVDCCALTNDFKQFIGGDQIQIGERGINLSGMTPPPHFSLIDNTPV